MTYILKRSTVFIMAVALGAMVANLYYAQPIVALIASSIGLKPEAAGLVVTLTQAGYGLGVLLLVPLGDILDSKKLIISMIFFSIFGILGLAFASTVTTYFLAALMTGLGASAIQALVPFASHLAEPSKRGQVVGTLMSGLMVGIMLSRPVASYLTDLFSWHAVFVLSAGLMAFVGVVFYFLLPEKKHSGVNLRYRELIGSMFTLYRQEEILRRRSIYQAFLFGAFCVFWTGSPIYLISPEFNFSQTQVAIFALVGVAGAVSAPFAGRAADKAYISSGTILSLSAASLSFLLSHFFAAGSVLSIRALVASAILLDAGVSANLVLGQRVIFSMPAELRSRINGLYVATIFIGGAIGSALGAWAYERGGWQLTSWVGFVMPALALLYFFTEKSSLRVRIKQSLHS